MSTSVAYPDREKLTPPEVARLWGINPSKVITWIRNGELRAINAATTRNGRPRYLIDRRDLEAFEARRTVTPAPRARRRRRRAAGVTEYF